jgi:hypothetical protein
MVDIPLYKKENPDKKEFYPGLTSYVYKEPWGEDVWFLDAPSYTSGTSGFSAPPEELPKGTLLHLSFCPLWKAPSHSTYRNYIYSWERPADFERWYVCITNWFLEQPSVSRDDFVSVMVF